MSPRSSPRNDPLARGPQTSWSHAILTFIEIGILVPLTLVLLMVPSDHLWPIVWPLSFFLLLRVPGDLARAFASERPAGLAVEGTMHAAAWATVPNGLAYVFTGTFTFGPVWSLGIAGSLFAGSLWGHHSRALTHAPRVGKAEGIVAAALAPVTVAASATAFPLHAPFDLVVPGVIFAVMGALSLSGILRLLRGTQRSVAEGGWTAWYQAHFFRLTLLLALVVVYLFIRSALVGIIPFLFLFEYSAAVAVAATFLLSLRTYANKQVTEGVPVGPNRRHEQAIERHSEPGFDRIESALGQFLEYGEVDAVHAATRGLETEGFAAGDALSRILGHRAETGVLLIHPGWLYAGRLLFALILAWSITQAAPIAPILALLVLGLGVYATQWNRFGGPWIVKSLCGLLGLGFLLVFLARIGEMWILSTLPGMLIAALGLGPIFVHPLRARSGRPVPRFLYQGKDPLDAIRPLIDRYDRGVLVRAAWLGGIGVLVFFFVGELARFEPAAMALFTLYAGFAIASFLQPVLSSVGLRVGRLDAQRRHARARAQRESLLVDAQTRLSVLLEESGPRRRSLRP